MPNDDLIKYTPASENTNKSLIRDEQGRLRIGTSAKPGVESFAQRAARLRREAQAKEPVPQECPDRIALLLDDSGSMWGFDYDSNKHYIDHLRSAVGQFLDHCDPMTTAIKLVPFNDWAKPLICNQEVLRLITESLNDRGGTPMAKAMQDGLEDSITRAILISDGEPDSELACYEQAQRYVQREIKIDCIHIGPQRGEECLKKIAELTGGLYLNFTDLNNFVSAMKYLAPASRASLPQANLKLLTGASEVQI